MRRVTYLTAMLCGCLLACGGCAAYRGGADARQLLPEIDIIALRDDASEALRQLRALSAELEALSQRIAALEASRTSAPPAREAPAPAPPRPAIPVPRSVDTLSLRSDDTTAGARYQRGLELFQARQYAQAAGLFEALLRQSPQGAPAENAAYWLAECRYAQGDYDEALRLFRQVAAQSGAARQQDALLKAGLCLMRLQRRGEARQAFERLLSEFPHGRHHEQARHNLSRLR